MSHLTWHVTRMFIILVQAIESSASIKVTSVSDRLFNERECMLSS